MRKMLVILLVLMLLVSNSVYTATVDQEEEYVTLEDNLEPTEQNLNNEPEEPGEPEVPEEPEEPEVPAVPGEPKVLEEIEELEDPIMDISFFDYSQEINYGWDVNSVLDKDQLDNTDVEVLFQTVVEKYLDSNILNITLEAEIDQEISIENIAAELGHVQEDGVFEVIDHKNLTKFGYYAEDGRTNLVLDIDMNINENISNETLTLSLIVQGSNLNDEIVTIINTSEIVLDDEPITFNANVLIETNLLEVIDGIGEVDVVVDDWQISAADLDENSTFEREVKIVFTELKETLDLDINIDIIGDDEELLDTDEVRLTLEPGLQETVFESMEITSLDIKQEVIYDWEIDSVINKEQQNTNTEATALFKTKVERHVKSNQLNMDLQAEFQQGVAIDSVYVELGYIVEDRFRIIEEFIVNDFEQYVRDGEINLPLNVDLNSINLNEEQLTLRLIAKGINAEGEIVTLENTHEFLLPEAPITVNEEVDMKTNLIKAIGNKGIVNVKDDEWISIEDEWIKTKDKQGKNGFFDKEFKINFMDIKEALDLEVEVIILGDNGMELSKIIVTMTLQDTILNGIQWNGNTINIRGFWLDPDMDGFLLERKVMPIKFWIKEKPSNRVSMKIFEINQDELGNRLLGDIIYSIYEDEFHTGIKGKRSKANAINSSGNFCTINLKGKSMPLLEKGSTYALAIMENDSMLVFEDEATSILTFTVTNDGMLRNENEKMELQRCGYDQKPRFDRNNLCK